MLDANPFPEHFCKYFFMNTVFSSQENTHATELAQVVFLNRTKWFLIGCPRYSTVGGRGGNTINRGHGRRLRGQRVREVIQEENQVRRGTGLGKV